MVDCSKDILFEDENIRILQPGDPRGVEVLHRIGYMAPIGENEQVEENDENDENYYYEDPLLKIIRRNGLKSSAALLKEKKGINAPSEYVIEKSPNKNVRYRESFLKYDPLQFSRIFLRPPSTAPQNWRDILGTEREHRLLFGGESYSDSAEASAYEEDELGRDEPIGIVTLRVDPDHTFVFFETMKGETNRNRETGMIVPDAWRVYPRSAERYQASKMLLSEYLDKLAEHPDEIKGSYEIIATLPNIPSCAFEKMIPYGIAVEGDEELEENENRKQRVKNSEKAWTNRGNELYREVINILKPANIRISEYLAQNAGLPYPSLNELSEQLQIVLRQNKPKKDEIIKLRESIKTTSFKIGNLLLEADKRAELLLPIQVDFYDQEKEKIMETVKKSAALWKEAGKRLKTMAGGSTRRFKKSKKSKWTRKY